MSCARCAVPMTVSPSHGEGNGPTIWMSSTRPLQEISGFGAFVRIAIASLASAKWRPRNAVTFLALPTFSQVTWKELFTQSPFLYSGTSGCSCTCMVLAPWGLRSLRNWTSTTESLAF